MILLGFLYLERLDDLLDHGGSYHLVDLRRLLEVVGDEMPSIGHCAHILLAGLKQLPGQFAHSLRVGGLQLSPLLKN